ncbi:Predicted arabinose efflux permease, MFS family [Halogranum amylolyticum]|uniref:Predicted arabinose efflux permease, MFS family n=1 Tax=Halogranum amylolyticum TaxID=660520 RepID=A0A1H8P164_9EURY|nr:Predicted arabinose efflux permease, MFS family [Halogranum amylolyticum]
MALFRDREFAALAGTAFARSQAYSTVLIALALYAEQFDTTGFVEGLFGTSFALAQLLIVLPLGRKIDTGNAKRFLLAGLVVNVAVFGGFALVENATHVVLMRVAQGVGASILWITGSTVVGEISPDDQSGRWLGSYNQVAAFSSLAGDVVGGYLLYAYDFRLTYLVLSLVTIGAFVLVFAFLRDNPGGKTDPAEATSVETFRTLLGRPMVRALVSFRLTFSFGKMAVIIFLPILARTEFGISAFAIGWILAGGKLTKSILQGYTGELTDRIGRKPYFVAAGALLYGVGTAAIPLSYVAEGTLNPVTVGFAGNTVELGGAFFALFAAYGLLGVADSLRLPASMSLFVDEGERFDSVASSMSLRSISWKVGQVIGPAVVGIIIDLVSTTAAFLTAAGFIVVATTVFTVVQARERQTTATVSTLGD